MLENTYGKVGKAYKDEKEVNETIKYRLLLRNIGVKRAAVMMGKYFQIILAANTASQLCGFFLKMIKSAMNITWKENWMISSLSLIRNVIPLEINIDDWRTYNPLWCPP